MMEDARRGPHSKAHRTNARVFCFRSKVALRLVDSEATRAVWPHAFSVLYTVTLTDGALSMRLEVTNTGEGPLSFTGALHTYLKVRVRLGLDTIFP